MTFITTLEPRPVALVTGASSGFGVEFAKLFAQDGIDLLLTAKPGEELATVAKQIRNEFGTEVHAKEFDLADPDAAQRLYDWAISKNLQIKYLVNNAGIGIYGRFADHPLEHEQELIKVNVNALSELCHLFIPGMITRGGGKILNVASIAGFQAGPYYATYFASKGYVLLFSEALHYEYAGANITVTALCPGVARTGFFKRAAMRENSRILQTYLMDPKVVVKAGYKGMMQGKHMVIPGKRNRFVAAGYRVLPRPLLNNITGHIVLNAAEETGQYTPPVKR